MSTAERTREALRQHPFLVLALRADILNYRATARFLDIGDPDAVAAALRRYRQELDEFTPGELDLRIRVRRNVDLEELAADGMAPGVDAPADDSYSAITAAGEPTPAFVATAVLGLATAGIRVTAQGATAEQAVFVVPNDDAAAALRTVEAIAAACPRVEAGNAPS